MSRRVEEFRGLAQASRVRLLAEVQRTPGLLLRELAERTGLHENTVRDHLIVLEDGGLIARRTVHTGTRGRPPATYHPVTAPGTNREAERRIERAAQHGDLLRRIEPAMGREDLDPDTLHQLDTLYEHLDDAGLQPDLDDVNLQIELVPCPYYDLIDRDPSLVCRVHSQLIRDVLAQVPGRVGLTLLEPFRTQDRCRVHLEVSTRSVSGERGLPGGARVAQHPGDDERTGADEHEQPQPERV